MKGTPCVNGVGSIMYVVVYYSRSNLAYAVNRMSQLIANLGHVHWQDLNWILRYWNGSLNGGLKYTRATQEEDAFEGYVDVKLCTKFGH